MHSKSNLGMILALIGINGITFSLYGFFMVYITRGFFAGAVLLSCILFFAGVSLLRDQLSHRADH